MFYYRYVCFEILGIEPSLPHYANRADEVNVKIIYYFGPYHGMHCILIGQCVVKHIHVVPVT